MIRVLVILLLATSGFLRFSTVVGDQYGGCGEHGCDARVVTCIDCCAPASEDAAFCSSSGGPCQCGVSKQTEPQPIPDAPLPRVDRDSLMASAISSLRVEFEVDLQRRPSATATTLSGILATLTNNEIQAFLGIWRT